MQTLRTSRETWSRPPLPGSIPMSQRQNAEYQLDRVASKWAENIKRNPTEIRGEIERILAQRIPQLHGEGWLAKSL